MITLIGLFVRAVLLLALVSFAFAFENLQHYLGPTTIGGDYMVKKEALQANYNGVTEEAFGTTTIVFPGVPAGPVVRDMQYAVGPNAVGYIPIPVKDVPGGSAEMDAFLRAQGKLGPDDQIFALIAYMHPEEHSGNMKQLATEYVKTESGQTHLGMYIGGGATRNSPENYHSKVWNVQSGNTGYPAIVQVLSYEGVPQALLNRNFYIVMTLLNNGVQFPSDYKNDQYRTINLKFVFQFFKDWLLDAPYLRSDDTYKTYCAEHVALVVNVGLNLPQNQASYIAVYGQEDGTKLWNIARTKFAQIAGSAMVQQVWDRDGGIDFTPLYEKNGVTDAAALNEQTFGKGLAWAAQANSDIMVNFLEAYASWPIVGGHVTVSTAFGFESTLVKRMSSSAEGAAYIGKNFREFLGRAAVLILVAEARSVPNIQVEQYFQELTIKLWAAFGGEPTAPNQQDPRFQLAQQLAGQAKQTFVAFQGAPTLTKAEAYAWFREQLRPILQGARELALYQSDNLEKLVRFNSPPATTHRIAIGVWPSDPRITIREVATAVLADHLRKKTPEEVARYSQAVAPAPSSPTATNGVNCRTAANKNKVECLSLRALNVECQRRSLFPCNGDRAQLAAKVAAARERDGQTPPSVAPRVTRPRVTRRPRATPTTTF